MTLMTIDDAIHMAAEIKTPCTTPAGNSWHMNWGITQHQYLLIWNGHCTHCDKFRKDIS